MDSQTFERLIIVAFGDSITEAAQVPEEQRWPHLLAEMLRESLPSREITVANAGVGGNTSREGLARLERDVLTHQPDLVLVEFGGNDATCEPERHVPLEEFTANLQAMRDRLPRETAMVLLTFPPVIDDWHCWKGHPFYEERGGQDIFIETYREETRRFAGNYNLPLIDIDRALRRACADAGTEKFILPDGVHLTVDGNRIVAEEVSRVLQLQSIASCGKE